MEAPRLPPSRRSSGSDTNALNATGTDFASGPQGESEMAQPIPLELPPRDPRKELLARVEAAPADHAEALLDALDLLEELHERRVFELLRGALCASDKIVEKTAAASDTPEAIRALRNLIILGKTL